MGSSNFHTGKVQLHHFLHRKGPVLGGGTQKTPFSTQKHPISGGVNTGSANFHTEMSHSGGGTRWAPFPHSKGPIAGAETQKTPISTQKCPV
uniref:Uncharacterized protein n=1 Tax=Columba livia TaxID=8932 RepID=R7VXJ9_COLLI